MGFNRQLIHRNGSMFNDKGFDFYGYDINGINRRGFNREGIDINETLADNAGIGKNGNSNIHSKR